MCPLPPDLNKHGEYDSRMKTEQTLLLEKIPALIGHELDIEASVSNGTILFYHGLGASKETLLPEITRLAAAGFFVVAVDAVGHGSRWDPTLKRLVDGGSRAHPAAFLEIISNTAGEISALIDELQRRQWINQGRIGIAGVSMGGYISFLAITLDSRLKVAATLLASPEWNSESTTSPHLHLEHFSQIKLLSQNAGRDEIVYAADVARFHSRLQQTYHDRGQCYRYVEYPESGHFMEEADWHRCIDKMIAWFVQHLPPR